MPHGIANPITQAKLFLRIVPALAFPGLPNEDPS
ncbi:hypothetical protein COLO4_34975 [Corchorus olitorius]|uniref:Uncharacterized protein n=1 Tax=Corchorus olitorius TaxID=93759 RepID=A0A1R3GIT9_9ROSI|nr:hypothetical protein COLO4_34975 [Corchorus olitorius]